MKKLTSLLIALCIVTSAVLLASCGSQSAEKDTTAKDFVSENGEADPNGEYKFGIITLVENGAFVDMKEGIIKALNDAGYTDDNTTVDYKCAQGDTTSLSTICASMDDGSYDAVFTVATPPTQSFVNLESDTPCFFCAVSAPVAAKVVTAMDTPDKNATGTSNAIPTSDIVDLAYKLTPSITKFGFIYCTSQDNATNTVNSACDYLASIDVSYTIKTVENSDEVASATEALIADGADVIFVPNDSVVQAGVTALAEICEEEGIPTYCSSATTVQSGCLATLAIDDKGIGEKTVALALKYMAGTALSDIPSVVVDVDYCTINEALAEKLNITIPSEDEIGSKINMYKAN